MNEDRDGDEPRGPTSSPLRVCELQGTWTVGVLERVSWHHSFTGELRGRQAPPLGPPGQSTWRGDTHRCGRSPSCRSARRWG